MSRTAAAIGLVFEEPPEPMAVVATSGVKRQPRRSRAGYVAPDSARPHGTRAKYVFEKCGCDPCRQSVRDYERRRQNALRRPDEVWAPYVPAGRAREHIRYLAGVGIGLKTISKVSGVSHGALWKLVHGLPGRGPSRRIRAETERRILSVTPAKVAGAQKIPAGPTWRLIDELIALGYPKAWIARELGAKGPGLQIGRTSVRASTARKVEELHRRVGGRRGPGKRSRWHS